MMSMYTHVWRRTHVFNGLVDAYDGRQEGLNDDKRVYVDKEPPAMQK